MNLIFIGDRTHFTLIDFPFNLNSILFLNSNVLFEHSTVLKLWCKRTIGGALKCRSAAFVRGKQGEVDHGRAQCPRQQCGERRQLNAAGARGAVPRVEEAVCQQSWICCVYSSVWVSWSYICGVHKWYWWYYILVIGF